MPHHIPRSTPGGGRPKRPHPLRLAAPAVLCLVALPVLAGCGGGGAKATPGVASLPTMASAASDPSGAASGTPGAPTTAQGGAPASPTAGDAGGDRPPQERLDDTPEEREALIHAWDQCLVDHGAQWTTTRAGVAGAPKQVADPVPPEASAACKNKLPLLPPELVPALNPHYRDDTLANIKCLRDHGIMVHLVADTSADPHGLGWTYDSSSVKLPDNESEIEDQCQLAAFGGKGK